MGQEIVYCFKCLTRLTGGDFEKGKAFRSGLKVSCKACLPELLAGLPPDERERVQQASRPRDLVPSTSTRVPAIRQTTARRRLEEGAAVPKGRGLGLGLGLAAGGIALLVAGLVLLRPSTPPPVPAPSPAPPPPAATKPPPEDPRLRPAREAFEKAKKAAAADPDARLALWFDAVRACQATPLHADALEAEQAVLALCREAWRKEIDGLSVEARARLAAGEHAKAEEVYEKAKPLRAFPEWGRMLSDRAAEVRREADRLYETLKARALEAARAGRADQAKAVEDQVARLGYPGLSAELRRELDATRPPPKPREEAPPAPPSAELLAYREAWRQAAALAASRELDRALTEQARASQGLKEGPAKAEAERDREDLERLPALLSELRRATPRLATGLELSLEIFDDDGSRKRVQGKVLRAWPGRVELSGEPSVFVETADLTAASLAEALGLLRKPAAGELRALAFLAAAEGDGAAALRLFAGLDEKHRELAKHGASRGPRRPEAEREARRLFFEAEREYREPASRGAAVLKYRRLAAEFAGSAIVKGDADLVRRRAEEGREAFFPPSAMKTGGTFRPGKGDKPESYWTSAEDSDAEKAVENFVEFEFLATPDTAYKAWIFAGGCCGEVFSFTWQATDLSGPNPRKSSETIQAPPDGTQHLPVRHGVSSLKSKHADHLGPKSPKRWAWIALPLPRYPAAGLKRVRILTNQKGFSVAYALASSARGYPPSEADLKELLARSSAAEPVLDPALIGWWRLDEKGGTAAAESSGKAPAGELRDGASWAPGRTGGAARFAEARAHVNVADFSFSGTALSVALWVQHDAAGGNQRYVVLGEESFVLRAQGDDDLHFYLRTDGELRHLTHDRAVKVGAWMHVAGTWDGTTQKLYKDGVLVASGKPGGTLAPFRRLRISNGGEAMKGLVDDVRVYARALTEADVQALFATGAAGASAPLEEPRPWIPVFDGKTAAFLVLYSQDHWKVESGALVRIPASGDAAQSREEFGDGEFRFRFEASGGAEARFSVRQGGQGSFTVKVDEPGMDGKPRELVFVCRGEEVKATLDGRPVSLDATGRGLRGHLQFGYSGGSVRILSIDRRELP